MTRSAFFARISFGRRAPGAESRSFLLRRGSRVGRSPALWHAAWIYETKKGYLQNPVERARAYANCSLALKVENDPFAHYRYSISPDFCSLRCNDNAPFQGAMAHPGAPPEFRFIEQHTRNEFRFIAFQPDFANERAATRLKSKQASTGFWT
jgi:hypothetical protein